MKINADLITCSVGSLDKKEEMRVRFWNMRHDYPEFITLEVEHMEKSILLHTHVTKQDLIALRDGVIEAIDEMFEPKPDTCCDCQHWVDTNDDPEAEIDYGTCSCSNSPRCGKRTTGGDTCDFVCIEVNKENCKGKS